MQSLAPSPNIPETLKANYLHLLKRCLTATLHSTIYGAYLQDQGRVEFLPVPEVDRHRLEEGREWPAFGETMIGLTRLDNLQHCVETILAENIPGDFIEAGVWRGGAALFMKAVLDLHQEAERKVWSADSFSGGPPPGSFAHPLDEDTPYHQIPFLRVSDQEVIATFQRYGFYDDRVRLVKGYFKTTLPTLYSESWALVRLDANTYESTMDGLVHLYPQLSPGGYLIVDDFGCCPPCQQAVEDYRLQNDISEKIEWIDWTGVYWQKSQ